MVGKARRLFSSDLCFVVASFNYFLQAAQYKLACLLLNKCLYWYVFCNIHVEDDLMSAGLLLLCQPL